MLWQWTAIYTAAEWIDLACIVALLVFWVAPHACLLVPCWSSHVRLCPTWESARAFFEENCKPKPCPRMVQVLGNRP